ncbi:MAG: LLM class flavin-dependent oxidoreductase [Chloroflexi bacterium]|nr:LLM class flavin-dependent oxidoreductase [Chloroflexota bacterium]
MKFGTFHLFQKPQGWSDVDVYRNELDQIRLAEDLGFDAVWLAEHHFQWYGVAADLMVIAGWVAARTQRVRIGTAIVVLPFHHPLRLAEQAAMVDIMSEGRLDFGIGRGYQAAEYAGFGISMDESRARFDECLDVLLKAWTEESFSYEGKYWQVSDVSVLPRPVQQPHPPVYVASWMTPETIKFAAERGFPILSPAGLASDQIKTNHELYRETLAAKGRDTSNLELPALVHIYVDEDEERGRQVGIEHSMRYGASLVTLGTPVQKGGQLSDQYKHYAEFGDPRRLMKETREELQMFGNPDTVARKIEWMRDELDVHYVMCWMNMGGLEQERIIKSMRLFAKEVMPRFGKVPSEA